MGAITDTVFAGNTTNGGNGGNVSGLTVNSECTVVFNGVI